MSVISIFTAINAERTEFENQGHQLSIKKHRQKKKTKIRPRRFLIASSIIEITSS